MKVELQIDELILEGVPGYQREQIASAIQQALTELVAAQGLPPAWQQGGGLAALTEQIQPGSRPEAIGRQVAQAMIGRARAEIHAIQPGAASATGMNTQKRSL